LRASFAKPSQAKPSQLASSSRKSPHPFATWLRAFFLQGLLAFVHSIQAAPLAADPQHALTLDALIALAIHSHPSVAAARAQYVGAQADISAARFQYYPSPSVQVLQDKGATSTVLTLQQPLWAGGRLDASLDAAKSQGNAAQVAIRGAQDAIALQVTAAWAAWVQARGRVNVQLQAVNLLKGYTESVSRRIEGGASGRVDQQLVVARLAQAHTDFEAANSAQRSALARLAQLTGQALSTQDLVDPLTADSADVALPPLDALIGQATVHSAALKRLEANIETSQHEIQQKRAALWPTVNLRAQHQRADSGASGASTSDSRLLLALEYTPGAGLSAGANIAAAHARLQALRDELQAAQRELAQTITADYEDFIVSRERKQSMRNMIDASAEVLASYERLFIAGRRNWLEVINAARELIQARAALVDAHAQHMAARARLLLNSGANVL
jgi:outer membrane protein, adhesin transport system